MNFYIIGSVLFSIMSVISWMVSFYSGYVVFNGEPDWYHYADAWGFGILSVPSFIGAFMFITTALDRYEKKIDRDEL